MSLSRSLLSFSLLSLFIGASACTHHTIITNRSDAVTATHTCVKTDCMRFLDSQNKNCDSCISRCGSLNGCDPSSVCDRVCDILPCAGNMETKCVESEWTFSVPQDMTAGVAEACATAYGPLVELCASHDEVQITPPDQGVCAESARVLTTAILPEFECLRSLDECSIDAIRGCILSSNFGNEICDSVEGRCPGACTDKERYPLDRAVVYKPEIQQAARDCTREPSCADVRGCLKGWVAAFD
jgi:hypothetical protein